jgi:hypothetical protein
VEEQEASQEKVKKKNSSAWKIWLISVALFLVGLFIIVPPFYANRILRPLLIEQFYQASQHKYHLDIKKIKWSLLRNSIQIRNIHIQPNELDTSRQVNNYLLSSFKLENLSLFGLHYLELLKGDIHFRRLIIDSLNTGLNRRLLNDSSSGNQMINSRKLLAFKAIYVDHVELKKLNLNYLEAQDTVLLCQEAKTDIDDFFIDISKISMPLFTCLGLSVKEAQWSKNGKKARLSGFKYAISSSNKMHRFLLGDLAFQNEKNGNLIRFRGGKIKIIGDSLLSNLMKNRLSAEQIYIHLHAVENRTQGTKKQSPAAFFAQIEKQWGLSKMNLQMESLEVDIDTLSNRTAQVEQGGQTCHFSSKSIFWNSDSFKYADMRFRLEAIRQYMLNSQDSLMVQSVDYRKHQLKLLGVYASGGTKKSSLIRIEALSLYPLNLEQLVNEKNLVLDEIIVNNPDIRIFEAKKLQNHQDEYLDKIEIAHLKIHQLNLESIPDALHIYHADCDADSIHWSMAKHIVWYDAFQDFNLRFDSLRLASSLKETDAFFGQSQMISNGGIFISRRFELNKRDELNRAIELQFQDMKLKGLNWKSILKKSHKYEFDSIEVARLKLDAFLHRGNGSEAMLDSLFVLRTKAINMPDVALDLHLIQEADTSNIHFQKLALSSDNFTINASLPQILTYSALRLQSLQSWISMPKDSLRAELASWHLDMVSKVLYLDALKLHFFSQDTVKKTKLNWDLYLHQAFFSGIDPFAYHLRRSIAFDTVRISKASLKLAGERNSEIKYQGESESFYQSFRSLVNQFSGIGLHYFELNGFDVEVMSKYLGRKDDIKLENINLGIQDFYVDYTSFEQMDEFLFSKDVNLEMSSFIQNINHGEKILKLEEIKVSSLDKRVFVNNIRFFSLGSEQKSPLIFSGQGLLLKDINMVSRPQLPELFIGNIVLNQSLIELNGGGTKKHVVFDMENLNLYESISHELSALKIENLELSQVDLHLNHLKKFGYQGLVLNDLHLSAENISIDSNNRVFTDRKFLYSDNLILELQHFSTRGLDPMYQTGFSKLIFNSRNRNIRIDSLKLTPVYDRAAFSANNEYQRDRVELMVPSLEVEEMGIRDMIFRKRFQAKRLILLSPDIRIFKDKTLPFDTSVYQPMPAQMLKELSFYLSLDTLRIDNGRLQYEELLNMMPQAGMVYFDRLNAEITGMTNDKDFRKFGGALKVSADARLMSTANVHLSSIFPLNSPKQNFVMTASSESFSASLLNPLTQPLSLISASGGDVEQMQMMVNGDNDVGVGSMSLRYSNLRIDVLRARNLKESQLGSFLANAILIKKNNNNIFVPRKGPIYFVRNKHRSIFNYFSHLAIVGAKTSLGIEKRKTEKRVKSYVKRNKF